MTRTRPPLYLCTDPVHGALSSQGKAQGCGDILRLVEPAQVLRGHPCVAIKDHGILPGQMRHTLQQGLRAALRVLHSMDLHSAHAFKAGGNRSVIAPQRDDMDRRGGEGTQSPDHVEHDRASCHRAQGLGADQIVGEHLGPCSRRQQNDLSHTSSSSASRRANVSAPLIGSFRGARTVMLGIRRERA